MVLRSEVFATEQRGAELDVSWGRVLRLAAVGVASVDREGDGGTDLLAGRGMEEDPLVKVTFGQDVHLVLTVQGFAGGKEDNKNIKKLAIARIV